MTLLDAMSVAIASGNVAAGVLIGPAAVVLRRAVYRHRCGGDLSESYLYAWSRQAQGIGWAVLFAAQGTLVAFGFTAGYPGFQFVQPLMIPVAAANFGVWLHQASKQGKSTKD
jgi:hypothetical protein